MESISYKLQVFEGPLDLLLHLIEKNKVDIYDIPISEITDQYLEYMRAMDLEDMDISSEFLVMAAELLLIKSKMLLPAETNEEGEEEDPRAGLVERLIEYKMFKYLAQGLSRQEARAKKRCYREMSIPEDLEYTPEPVDLEKLLDGVDLSMLQRVFAEVMQRSRERIDPVKASFGRIEEEPVNYAAKTTEIRQYIKKEKKNISFRKMLENSSSMDEVIVSFLVILELMRDGTVQIRQDTLFDDIYIEALE